MLLLVDVHEHHLNKETRKSNSHGNVDEFYEVSNEPHDGKPDSDSPTDLDEFWSTVQIRTNDTVFH